MNRFSRVLGDFLSQTARGFEFLVAAATIVNGWNIAVLRPNGRSLAPFISQAVEKLAPLALWSTLMIAFGVVLLLMFFLSFADAGRRFFLAPRATMHALTMAFYLVVVALVITGDEPDAGAARYAVTAFAAMCVSSYLIRLIVERDAKSHKGGGA